MMAGGLWVLVVFALSPVDVTDVMTAPPGRTTLDLSEPLIAGDLGDGVRATLRAHRASIEPCLQRLGLTPAGHPDPAIRLDIRPDGTVGTISILGTSPTAEACLRDTLGRVRFPTGRARTGLVPVKTAAPTLRGAHSVRWRVHGPRFEAAVTARRWRNVFSTGDPEHWLLNLKIWLEPTTALAVGSPMVRHDYTCWLSNGRAARGSGPEAPTRAPRCVDPPGGILAPFVEAARPIRKGERCQARLYLMTGPCGGRAPLTRRALGTIELDWRHGERPVIRPIPDWAGAR